MKRWIRAIIAVVLVGLLSACSPGGSVPGNVLKKAIALKVDETQQTLSQQLKLSAPPKVTIDRVKVNEQTSLKIEGLQGYRVKGSYDFTLKLPKRQISQRENQFDVYLQRQVDGKTKTWKLAKRQPDGGNWVTQAIER